VESERRRLGDFEIVREIGRGGMGVVYEAIQLSLNRPVALKVLPPGTTPEQRDIERFQREAQAAAALDHPNIVPIYAQGEEEGTYYYAMKLVQGRSLNQVIQATRRTQDAELAAGRSTALSQKHSRTAAQLIMEAAEALEYAHSQGVIHRDIKPHNLILTPEGHLVITDFGIARFLSAPSITISGEMMGTPAYMSPEQVRAEQQAIDQRTDIYSLGITLYEMLALYIPFWGETREALLRQILMKDPAPLRRLNPRIPRDLETICAKAIEKDPERRYQSAKLLAHDLQCFLEGLPITARPIGPASLTMYSYLNMGYMLEPQSFALNYMMNSFKLLHSGRIRGRRFPWAVAIAMLGVLIAASIGVLYTAYYHGASSLLCWPITAVPTCAFRELNSSLLTPEEPSNWLRSAMVVGGGFALVLSWLSSHYSWWPFSPIGFLVASVMHTNRDIWANAFIGWFLATVTRRFGGLRLYRTLRPAFLGIIFGHYLTDAAMALFANLVLGVRGVTSLSP